MRIVVTGGEGQLGRALARRAGDHEVVALGRDAADVCALSVRDVITARRPDVVVNAAAMTAVDGCETDPDAAYAVNALGARNVALGATAAGAALVQVSTDYVFDGKKGAAYWEFDAPAPVNVYGASKLSGERCAAAASDRLYIVRAAWLYGVGGDNFVTRILRLASERPTLSVVVNEFGSPTFCDDLADAILALVETGAFGTYHLSAEGVCSRYDFARAVLDGAGLEAYPLTPTDHFPRAATPPAYAPLRNFAAAALGIRLPHWREGLSAYFDRCRTAAG